MEMNYFMKHFWLVRLSLETTVLLLLLEVPREKKASKPVWQLVFSVLEKRMCNFKLLLCLNHTKCCCDF